MSLRLQSAAGLEVLAHPPHGSNAVAEAGGDLAGFLALVVKFEDALADADGDGFHGPDLPHPTTIRYMFYGNDLKNLVMKPSAVTINVDANLRSSSASSTGTDAFHSSR